MAAVKMPNPHQESIDKLANRVLPLVRAMPFAQNRKEPWLGNAMVDKAVIATIETCFAIADQDRLQAQAEFAAESAEPEVLEAPEDETTEVTPPVVIETVADGSQPPQV